MKRIALLLLAGLAALLMASSCAPISVSAEMRILANDVEANYKHYTQEDWDRANSYYKQYCDEYRTKKLTMSQEEKEEFREAQGRYLALVAKGAVEGVTESIQEIVPDSQEVESFLKGVFKSDDDKDE
ncbi:MAG: hypothetical protein J6Y63_08170 [Bacteroidales bacterium]|jgi:hypothetical protein|nr:hypothetical protein [Bacteroidales bacterium]